MYYILIPHQVYAKNDIPDSCKIMYGLVLSLSQKDGYCYAENTYLANALGKSVRSIGYYLETLVKHGLITIEIANNRFRRIYTVTTQSELFKGKKLTTSDVRRIQRQTNKIEWLDDYIENLKTLE